LTPGVTLQIILVVIEEVSVQVLVPIVSDLVLSTLHINRLDVTLKFAVLNVPASRFISPEVLTASAKVTVPPGAFI
jgi:hypothetical protein